MKNQENSLVTSGGIKMSDESLKKLKKIAAGGKPSAEIKSLGAANPKDLKTGLVDGSQSNKKESAIEIPSEIENKDKENLSFDAVFDKIFDYGKVEEAINKMFSVKREKNLAKATLDSLRDMAEDEFEKWKKLEPNEAEAKMRNFCYQEAFNALPNNKFNNSDKVESLLREICSQTETAGNNGGKGENKKTGNGENNEVNANVPAVELEQGKDKLIEDKKREELAKKIKIKLDEIDKIFKEVDELKDKKEINEDQDEELIGMVVGVDPSEILELPAEELNEELLNKINGIKDELRKKIDAILAENAEKKLNEIISEKKKDTPGKKDETMSAEEYVRDFLVIKIKTFLKDKKMGVRPEEIDSIAGEIIKKGAGYIVEELKERKKTDSKRGMNRDEMEELEKWVVLLTEDFLREKYPSSKEVREEKSNEETALVLEEIDELKTRKKAKILHIEKGDLTEREKRNPQLLYAYIVERISDDVWRRLSKKSKDFIKNEEKFANEEIEKKLEEYFKKSKLEIKPPEPIAEEGKADISQKNETIIPNGKKENNNGKKTNGRNKNGVYKAGEVPDDAKDEHQRQETRRFLLEKKWLDEFKQEIEVLGTLAGNFIKKLREGNLINGKEEKKYSKQFIRQSLEKTGGYNAEEIDFIIDILVK